MLLAPVPRTKGVMEFGRTKATEVWMSWLLEVSLRISLTNEVEGVKVRLKEEEVMGLELYEEAIAADVIAWRAMSSIKVQ